MKGPARVEVAPETVEVVLERHPTGARRICEYRLDGAIVGRCFHEEDGRLHFEQPMRGGRPHGMARRYEDGRLIHAEPYEDGLAHGTSHQWDREGNLLGTYELDRGTGVDLWWDRGHLAEEHHLREGWQHGFERWYLGPGRDERGTLGLQVYEERHWKRGVAHGIHREWDGRGRMPRGWPRFFVDGVRVTKAAYRAVARSDPTLPPYDRGDDRPYRPFPPGARGPAGGSDPDGDGGRGRTG